MKRLGEMTRQISIQSYTEQKDSYGTPIKTWGAHLSNIWCDVEEMSGSEDFETEQKTARNKKAFYIRYRTGINETMRVVYKSEYYDIDYVEVLGQYKYLKIVGEVKD